MKKLISLLATFIFIASLLTGTILTVSAETSLLSGDYKFVDVAYSSTLKMYVAAAKGGYSTDNKTYYIKLFYSKDKINWTSAFTTAAGTSNYATTLTQSVEWWGAQNTFAAYVNAKVYFSPDGVSWTDSGISQRANGGIIAKDEQLVAFGGRALKIGATTSSYTDITFAVDTNFYPTAAGVSKKRSNGTKKYIMASSGYVYSFEATYSGSVYTYPTAQQPITDAILANTNSVSPYDFVYNEKRDEWLMIYGGTKIKMFRGSEKTSYESAVNLPSGALASGITAAYINDSYIVIGLANGEVYYTQNPDADITSAAVWTKIENKSGTTAMTEQVTKIIEGEAGEFLITSFTQIYTATIGNYVNINEYVNLGTPEIVGANPFSGVKLLGGVYSPELDKYVVYGNTSDSKPAVFTSSDEVNWTKQIIGTALFLETANGAVWWNEQGKFILSASTSDTTGGCYYSLDGVKWYYLGNMIGLRSELCVAGGKLYSTNGGRTMYKFNEFSIDQREALDLSTVDTATRYYTSIAASNEADPAIFLSVGTMGLVRNNASTAGTEVGKWAYKSNINNNSTMGTLDLKFSSNLNQFVVTSRDKRMTIVDKSGTAISGPANPTGMYAHYVDTNGSKYVFGVNNNLNTSTTLATSGGIYKVDDNANLATSVLSKIFISQSGCEESTMPVTNVFTGKNGKIMSTVSDRTNSDILIVDASATGYIKVSDNIPVTRVNAGETFSVRVRYTNKPQTAIPVKMISGIYSNNQLLQLITEDKSMAAGGNSYMSQNITIGNGIPNTAQIKVFLWEDYNTLRPISGATGFFQ